jgi:hypothetical protein
MILIAFLRRLPSVPRYVLTDRSQTGKFLTFEWSTGRLQNNTFWWRTLHREPCMVMPCIWQNRLQGCEVGRAPKSSTKLLLLTHTPCTVLQASSGRKTATNCSACKGSFSLSFCLEEVHCLIFLVLVFWDRVSLCSPRLHTHNSPASVPRVWEVTHSTTLGWLSIF